MKILYKILFYIGFIIGIPIALYGSVILVSFVLDVLFNDILGVNKSAKWIVGTSGSLLLLWKIVKLIRK